MGLNHIVVMVLYHNIQLLKFEQIVLEYSEYGSYQISFNETNKEDLVGLLIYNQM